MNVDHKIKIFFLAIIFLALFGWAESAWAATYYVDQNHPQTSDSNSGLEILPWATIQKAASTIVAGDTVNVRSGTYFEQVTVLAPHGGTPGNPIVFQAYPGDHVIIDGDGVRSHGFRIGVSYAKVVGFEVQNVTSHGILVGWSTGASEQVEIRGNSVHNSGSNANAAAIYYAGGSGGRIEDNHLYGNSGDGIAMNTADLVIRNNNIHHNQVDGIKGGGSGIHLIEENTIHDMTSEANHGDCMQLMGMTGEVIVRNNTVWDCTQGIYLDDYSSPAGSRPWGDAYIYNNVVYNTKWNGTSDTGYSNGIVTGPRYNNWNSETIYENTLIDLNSGSGGISIRNPGDQGPYHIAMARVHNNLFYNSINQVDVSSIGDLSMDYNLYFNEWRNWYLSGWVSLDVYQGQQPNLEQNSFYSDITFLNYSYSNPDFHLAEGSRAIGRGYPLESLGGIDFAFDRNGIHRPQGSAWDIGAYEFVSEGDTTAPSAPQGLSVQ